MKTNMIGTIVTLVLLTSAPMALAGPMSAQSQGDADTACKNALSEARTQLIDAKEAGSLNVMEATAIVDQVAGPACGFSVLSAQFPQDTEWLARMIREVTGDPGDASGTAATEQPENNEPHSAGDGDRIVACSLAGGGDGTITADILGIDVDEATAAGQWDGADSVVDLTGSAALVSGNQIGPAGSMFLGPAGPLPSIGSSGATCMETTSVIVVKTTCYGIPPVWYRCVSEVKTTVSLTLCGAEADQDLLDLGLLHYDHSYIANGNPCEIASLGAFDFSEFTSSDSNTVILSEDIEEVISTPFAQVSGSASSGEATEVGDATGPSIQTQALLMEAGGMDGVLLPHSPN